ncbi:DUF4178 domain-containing protein [Patescibacteria group bacterium]|nr:MAG: DUF4178 domain-containing protein [Patescibacteria group bacterium]
MFQVFPLGIPKGCAYNRRKHLIDVMTIDQLLSASIGTECTVHNEPFAYVGRADVTLDGGDVRRWLYGGGGDVLAISPDDEEIILFKVVEEELEPQGDTVLYGGKEYEFSYEDSGIVSGVEGDASEECEDRLTFSEYQSEDGERLRLVTSENRSETSAYLGTTVVEEDILPIE